MENQSAESFGINFGPALLWPNLKPKEIKAAYATWHSVMYLVS